jgi:hypothetical protein
VHAFRADGSRLPGFPKPTSQYGLSRSASPALGDIDGDGLKEIVWIDGSNRVNVWTVPGTAGPPNFHWPMFRGSATHTAALPVDQ